MTEQLEWTDPPAVATGTGGVGNGRRYRMAAMLRERPGQWAIIDRGTEAKRTFVTQVRTGQVPAFTPTTDWECVSRKVAGEVRVFARYVGNGSVSP